MRDSLRKAAFLCGHPVRQRARGRGKCCAFSQAQQDAAQNQCCQAAHQPCQHRRACPDHSTYSQRQAGPEPVTQPASPHLQGQIGPAKRGEHPAQFDGAEMQVLLKNRACRVHVDPVNIREPIHQADHEEHESGGGEYSSEQLRFGALSRLFVRCGHGFLSPQVLSGKHAFGNDLLYLMGFPAWLLPDIPRRLLGTSRRLDC